MSHLKPILKRFLKTDGVMGVVICTSDGIVIDSEVSQRFDAETVSALASSVGLALGNATSGLGLDDFSLYHIYATKGDIIMANLGKSFFVAIVEQGSDFTKINVEIFQTTTELKRLAVIG